MPSRSSASPLAALLLCCAIALGACAGATAPGEGASLTVYVSLPLSGPAATEGRDAADGARLALAEGPAEIGGYAIEAEILDAGASAGGWSPALAAANARAASHDSTAIAYLGDFQSGATRASLPITNSARLLQVSPASGALDLVAPSAGSDRVPDVQHSGSRTFGRVIASDGAQATAAGAWAADLGWESARIDQREGEFAKVLAGSFTAAAETAGVRLADEARRTYLAGSASAVPARPAGGGAPGSAAPELLASDAFLPPYLPDRSPQPSLYATSAALDPRDLPPAGAELAARFEERFGRPPGRYAAYGYEAMAVIVDSISRASDPADRDAVVEAFFSTASRDSVLGPYSITERGETTLSEVSGYLRRGGRAVPVAKLEIR